MSTIRELANTHATIRSVRDDYESMRRNVWFDEYVKNRGKKYEEAYWEAIKKEGELLNKLEKDPQFISRVQSEIDAYKNGCYKFVTANWSITGYDVLQNTLRVYVELSDNDADAFDIVLDIKV